MIRSIKLAALGLAAGMFSVGGCAQHDHHGHAHAKDGAIIRAADMGAEVKEAIAVVRGTEGNDKVKGWVKFSEAPGTGGAKGVNVVAHIEGLNPGQEHGFHIHEFGDLTDMAKAMSTGGHYNPGGHQHGKPGDDKAHVGDMGNLKADDKGVAHLELNLPAATLTAKNAILGRAVIVHANPDKFTQPVGDAGPRIGVGVIGVAQVKK